MTIPSGNGEARGPESAPSAGNPLPLRPARPKANNAKYADFLGATPVADQAGLGTEDMQHDAAYLNRPSQFWSQAHTKEAPPDLAALGNGGETFGG